MSKRNVVTAVAMIGAAGLFTGCNFSQPTAGCIVQDGEWMAKYTLKTTEHAGQACGSLKGEALGVYKFAEFGKANATILTIRPQTAAAMTMFYYDLPELDSSGNPVLGEDGKPVIEEEVEVERVTNPSVATAISSFAEEIADDGFCAGSAFAETTVAAAEVVNKRSGEVEAPAETITYAYKDVKVYADPSAPGSQLTGTFTFTKGGCTAEYEMNAIWPAVGCKVQADCEDGSGINPDFDVVCDTELEACVPAKAIPSL